MNLKRIAKRVENGGHDIPKEDVLRRHSISRENLLTHLFLMDTVILVDNTGKEGQMFATIENGFIKEELIPIPRWGEDLLQLIKEEIN
ncbi:hypothetical protein [Shouchella shacheensis]|uniref:hypothetical protein n=1 Tax=Shouchella shacheensis TaxID=1649580 RepID=UPI00073FE071|nr:hypothetical protein [Shouchella shacheensis]